MSRQKTTLRTTLATLDQAFRTALRAIFKDAGVLTFVVLLPLFYPLLYSFIYTRETVREVPFCVVDLSQTSASREFIRRVDASPACRIAARRTDLRAARSLVERREVYGIVVVPADFSHALVRGERAHVSIYCDMSGMLYYKALLVACTDVSLDMNADIKVQRAPGTTRSEDAATRRPLRYESVSLYNPQSGYAAFLIPAVLVLVLQQALLLGVGMAAGTRREQRQAADTSAPAGASEPEGLLAAAAGTAAWLVPYVPAACYVLGVVPRLFRLPHLADWGDFALFVVPFLLAILGFSLFVSLFVRTRERVMLLVVFTSVPLLFLSGVSWPGSAVPTFWKWVAAAFPSTFGINACVRLQSMGAELSAVRGEVAALWLQAGIYFGLWAAFRRQSFRVSR